MKKSQAELGKMQADADHDVDLLHRQLKRAQRKVSDLQQKVVLVPESRTADEWAELSRSAKLKAVTRERKYLMNFMKSHEWRAEDLDYVLSETGLLVNIFTCRYTQSLHLAAVDKMFSLMESEDLGISFALFLHFELHLTIDKIMQIVNAAAKKYVRETDTYERKIALYHPHLKSSKTEVTKVKFPRLAPPKAKIEAVVKSIYEDLGIEPAENGRVAIKPASMAIGEMLAQDCGKRTMPLLSEYEAGLGLDLVFSGDATGFGNQQFNTYGLNNPHMSKSAQNFRVFGLGNCDDGREGSRRVLGPNLAYINSLIIADECNECVDFEIAGEVVSIRPKVFLVDDVSKIRHGEHLANSGFCGCSRHQALRVTPQKPRVDITLDGFVKYLKQCHSHSRIERYVLSHNTVPGEEFPRKCTAPGCTFGHGTPAEAIAEQEDLFEEERKLKANDTTAGRAAFSKWRMEFAHRHLNVQPGKHGEPFLVHHFDKQILDPLHYSELGHPKTPWKHGVLVNASDDARELISQQLAIWKHPLDTRRKDNSRVTAQKWFTGEKWATFCSGKRGSPGGRVAIAALVHIIADDLQRRGVDAGSGLPEVSSAVSLAPTKKKKRGVSASDLADVDAAASGTATAMLTDDLPAADAARLKHVPTAIERRADPDDLAIIRQLYGSRAQTIINTLLSFDAYFDWYYPLKKSIPFLAPMEVKFPRALSNCRLAIDMHEIFERLAIRKHGSFLPHGSIFKVSRDILEVGDVWATDLSKLELQNADTKRTASQGGARNLTMSEKRLTIAPQRTKTEGPAQLVWTKGYGTSMSLSTMRKLLGLQYLRMGEGLIATPMSRRKERLFGVSGSGRTSGQKVLGQCDASTTTAFDPHTDTCVKAYLRLLDDLARAVSPD